MISNVKEEKYVKSKKVKVMRMRTRKYDTITTRKVDQAFMIWYIH